MHYSPPPLVAMPPRVESIVRFPPKCEVWTARRALCIGADRSGRPTSPLHYWPLAELGRKRPRGPLSGTERTEVRQARGRLLTQTSAPA